jgi:FK506-binding protein 1
MKWFLQIFVCCEIFSYTFGFFYFCSNFPIGRRISRPKFFLLKAFAEYTDISVEKNGHLLKKTVTRGHGGIKGYPQRYDFAVVDWIFKDLNDTVIHNSNQIGEEDKPQFMIGANQVIRAMDIGVKTMYEGETASFVVSPEYGWGVEGFEPLFQPNQTFILELTLLKMVIGLRQYETVTPDYDFRADFERKLDSGEINMDDLDPSPNDMEETPLRPTESTRPYERVSEDGDDGCKQISLFDTEPSLKELSSENPTSKASLLDTSLKTTTTESQTRLPENSDKEMKNIASNASTVQTPSPKAEVELLQDEPEPQKNKQEIVDQSGRSIPPRKIRFFDPTKHKLDPNRCVRGMGKNHTWEETTSSVTVDVSIADQITKSDLQVYVK